MRLPIYYLTSNLATSIFGRLINRELSSGGVQDVLYYNNTMSETREQWGQGIHVKARIGIGGYIKNIVWDSNVYHSTGTEGEI